MAAAKTMRALRVDEADWEAAAARAGREQRTLSDVIRVAVRAYGQGRYDAVEPPRRKP